jgi:hypothetical protein
MRKRHISVRCKGCGKGTSTTKFEQKDNFLCLECRGNNSKLSEQEEQKPTLFKRISDWAVRNFGSG